MTDVLAYAAKAVPNHELGALAPPACAGVHACGVRKWHFVSPHNLRCAAQCADSHIQYAWIRIERSPHSILLLALPADREKLTRPPKVAYAEVKYALSPGLLVFDTVRNAHRDFTD